MCMLCGEVQAAALPGPAGARLPASTAGASSKRAPPAKRKAPSIARVGAWPPADFLRIPGASVHEA